MITDYFNKVLELLFKAVISSLCLKIDGAYREGYWLLRWLKRLFIGWWLTLLILMFVILFVLPLGLLYKLYQSIAVPKFELKYESDEYFEVVLINSLFNGKMEKRMMFFEVIIDELYGFAADEKIEQKYLERVNSKIDRIESKLRSEFKIKVKPFEDVSLNEYYLVPQFRSELGKYSGNYENYLRVKYNNNFKEERKYHLDVISKIASLIFPSTALVISFLTLYNDNPDKNVRNELQYLRAISISQQQQISGIFNKMQSIKADSMVTNYYLILDTNKIHSLKDKIVKPINARVIKEKNAP
jgi:hypothetical protein